MTPSAVKLWTRFANDGDRSHIVACTQDYYQYTLCGTLGNGTTHTDRPTRICRKCRERLKDAQPARKA